MTEAEALVLGLGLVAVAVVYRTYSTLHPRLGAILATLALLAVAAVALWQHLW